MKKKLLILFFTGHLMLIFFQALWADIDSFWSFHYDKTPDIPILKLFKQNQYTEPYYILTGTNTGYGFYGTHTSTEKYLRIIFMDSSDKEIKTDRYFKLETSNGITRLEGYASFLTNYVADTKTMIDSDTGPIETEDPKVKQLRRDYQFRKDYIVKSLKWLGKREANKVPKCISYKIELITIVPEDVWSRNRNDKPKIYVVQQGVYPVQ